MKRTKRALALLLSAILAVASFSVGFPYLKVEANAVEYDANGNIVIGGITQKRVVGTDGSYSTTYAQYAKDFLTTAEGINCGEPTNMVIPGLQAADDFIVQGLSYYAAKDWVMVSAYHKTAAKPSMIFALSAKTGNFEGAFAIYNQAGISSPNYDHGGGLAFSEYNFYYSGDDSDVDDGDGNADRIAYAPLSQFDNPSDSNGDGLYEIILKGEVDLPEMNGAATAYVCYDEGILWAGNFYEDSIGAGDYNKTVITSPAQYNSMIYGYKLAGGSSQEEWDNLTGKFQNLFHVATTSGTASANNATMTWSAYENSDTVNVTGTITPPSATVGELLGNGFGAFTLKEGVNYTIEFISTNVNTDMYIFSPKGTHTNVKQSSQTTITKLEDGRYHYSMNFTAGLKPAGADSSWPTTQSTDESYTGNYTVRFDQDAIGAGETRNFAITDIRVSQTNTYGTDEKTYNIGSAGLPSYCVAVHTDFEDIQYAIVDKGRIYLSRSWGTGKNDETIGNVVGSIGSTPDWSTLTIGDIDLSVPGDVQVTHNTGSGTRTTDAYLLGHDNSTSYDLMPMSEGLCFIEDNLYISFEGASNKYMNEYAWSTSALTNTGNCDYPIDVVWRVDPYALRSEKRPVEDKTAYYEKIYNLSDIESGEDYMIVYESSEVDPITQKNVLYAFDADGGFNDYNLAKSSEGAIKGYDGMVCHPITQYATEEDRIYLTNPEQDDLHSIHWKLTRTSNYNGAMASYSIKNSELYFSSYPNLYFNSNTISMAKDNVTDLANIQIYENGDGDGGFWFSNAGAYFLWCNESLSNNYTKKINNYYAKNGSSVSMYSGLSEKAGTIHCDALFTTGNNIIGGAVESGGPYYEHGTFNIYKRVLDPYAEQQESRVFTNMTADVQSDGTYTVNLETYAISSSQYKKVDDRPTDFILVLDASSSMENNSDTGMTGWKRYSSLNKLSLESAAGNENAAKTYDTEYSGNIYYRHTDAQYCKLKCMTHYVKKSGLTTYIKVKLWYTANGQNYYLMSNGSVQTTEPAWDNCVQISGNSVSGRAGKTIYTGPHYEQTTLTRLDAMKLSVDTLIDRIASQAALTGLNHRIALVQYGSGSDESYYNTGLYKNDTSFVQYSGSGTISNSDYAATFFDVTDAESLAKLKYRVLEGVESPSSKDADTFANHGFEMAKGIVTGSGANYSVTGNRSACVLMITDGVPGKGGSDSTSANNTANEAIAQAKGIKDAGGYVFTAQLGSNSMSGFDMDKYMNYTSSEYVKAENLNTPGDRNIKDIEYRKDFPLGGSFNLESFVSTMFDSIQANSKYALVQLDGNSIIQQKLSEVFDVSNAETPTATIQDGYYDCIGRLTFDNTQTSTEIETQISDNTIQVSGFDYSAEYISKEKPGKKLNVTVKGLLPKSNVTFLNTAINNDAYTAIYQSEDDAYNTTVDNDLAFKHFPSETFNIPEYTYVLDYGLQMLDTDVNGTLCAASDYLTEQNPDNYNKVAADGDLQIQPGDENLLYSLSVEKTKDSGYILIRRDEGNYDWFKINIVPASNVLFEESEFTIKDSANIDWATSTDGSPKATYQSLADDDTDVYGYDDAYAVGKNVYSNGSALKATVNSTNKRTDSATFAFKGTGFDLISACGANTGMQIVTVRRADNSIAKVMIVDTYYNDTTYVDATNKVLNQVPIANFTGDYGEYTVEVTATYLSYAGALTGKSASRVVNGASVDATAATPVGDAEIAAMLKSVGMGELAKEDVEVIWFDDNSIFNGGTGAEGIKSTRSTRAGTGVGVTELVNYIDGIRIYHPMASEYGDYVAGEQGAQYVNVIENLVNNSLVDNGTAFGLAYVEGALAEGEALSFANYQKIGPDREFYLAGGNSGTTTGLAFNIDAPAGAKIMLGLRAINGATTVKVNGTEFPVNSATEMYYDITEILNGSRTITIANTGSSPLAVNNIKLSGNAAVGVLSVDDMGSIDELMTMETVEAEVVNGTVTVPTPEEEPEIPEDTTGDDSGSSWFNILDMIMAIIGEFLKTIMSFMG